MKIISIENYRTKKFDRNISFDAHQTLDKKTSKRKTCLTSKPSLGVLSVETEIVAFLISSFEPGFDRFRATVSLVTQSNTKDAVLPLMLIPTRCQLQRDDSLAEEQQKHIAKDNIYPLSIKRGRFV